MHYMKKAIHVEFRIPAMVLHGFSDKRELLLFLLSLPHTHRSEMNGKKQSSAFQLF